ncbi:MAG: hypothetical protein ACREPM_16705 [Gemmatimonadaceae bacterium]
MMRTSSVAAALAVLPTKDGSPRVIRQFTSVFLVSRGGELWQVYDTDAAGNADRHMPAAGSRSRHRLFEAIARDERVRVHTFSERESHDVDPIALQEQLDDSSPA